MSKIHANNMFFIQDKKSKTISFLYRDRETKKLYDLDGNEFVANPNDDTKQDVKLWDHIEITKRGRKARVFGFLQWGTSSYRFPKKAIRYFYLGAIINPSAMIEFNAWPIKEITNKHYQVNNLKRLQQKLTQHYQSQSCELQR